MDSLVIANLFLLLFLGLADNQMIAALLPSLVKSLGISLSTAGLLVVVYSLAAAVAAFFSGTLSDHYGRRRFLLAGVAFFAVASWAASQSRTLNELMLARALTGLAAGTLSTCSITFAADWFPYNVRGRAIGLISSAYFAAPILGVPIAAQIADRFGWRRAFLFFAGLAVVTTLATLRLPRERLNPQPSTEKLRTAAEAFRSFLARRDTAAALVIAFLVSGGLVGFLTYIGAVVEQQFWPSHAHHWMGFHAGRHRGCRQRSPGGNSVGPLGKARHFHRQQYPAGGGGGLCPLLAVGIGTAGGVRTGEPGRGLPARALDRADDGNGARGAARLIHRLAEYLLADGDRRNGLPGRSAVPKIRVRRRNLALRGDDRGGGDSAGHPHC